MTKADWCWAGAGLIVGGLCAWTILQALETTYPPVHFPGADPTQVVPFGGRP